MRIGILHTRLRIEERRLIEALTARGAEVVPLPESAVAFDLHGRGYQSLDLVVERCQDYTLAQTALRILEHLGVPTINRPATVDLCGNKALLAMKLGEAGVPTPRVEVALSTEAALAAIERLGYPIVTKPLVGGDTQLLALIEDRETAEAILEHKAMLGTDRHHVYFLQEYIAKPGRDIRVLVIGEEPLAAEYRQSNEWVTSRDRRAPHVPCPLTPEIADLARRAARTFGGGVFEVDLLESPRGLLVNEVGAINAFRPFETAGVEVAGPIADYILTVAAQPRANGGRATAHVGV
ncbi:MAG: Alpha-aminoadipate--LysW ligase (EC [uncultured Thermomicrobiales bacterium]|uniref:Alpha-aminoadipate--LysW ligase (EC) n=1 Tax=uncultured Thermomicrobiales bacterium TaxID=1645740 RepID=A0A6J4VPG1_9BACT|nr:MAG: Alpha-aminoadipate--LysW ligase (EC [uncultured Thermomicrobiales bacterium]